MLYFIIVLLLSYKFPFHNKCNLQTSDINVQQLRNSLWGSIWWPQMNDKTKVVNADIHMPYCPIAYLHKTHSHSNSLMCSKKHSVSIFLLSHWLCFQSYFHRNLRNSFKLHKCLTGRTVHVSVSVRKDFHWTSIYKGSTGLAEFPKCSLIFC